MVGSSSSRGEVSVPETSRNTPSDETQRYKEHENKQSKGNSEDSWTTSRVGSAATPDISLFSQSTSIIDNVTQQDANRMKKVSAEHRSADDSRCRCNSIQGENKATDNYTIETPVTLHWKDLRSSIFSDSDEDKEYGLSSSDYVKNANTANYSPEQDMTKQPSHADGHSSSNNTSEGYMSDFRLYSTLTTENKPDGQVISNHDIDFDIQTGKNKDNDNMPLTGNKLSNALGNDFNQPVMESTSASNSIDEKDSRQQPPSNDAVPQPVATSTPMRSESMYVYENNIIELHITKHFET